MRARTLEALQAELREFRDARDWRQFHTLRDLAAAIAVEAAELQEVFLWQSIPDDDLLAQRSDRIREELADVVIQCLNFADVARIDVLEAASAKLAANTERYPVDRAKGSSKKYTEL